MFFDFFYFYFVIKIVRNKFSKKGDFPSHLKMSFFELKKLKKL